VGEIFGLNILHFKLILPAIPLFTAAATRTRYCVGETRELKARAKLDAAFCQVLDATADEAPEILVDVPATAPAPPAAISEVAALQAEVIALREKLASVMVLQGAANSRLSPRLSPPTATSSPTSEAARTPSPKPPIFDYSTAAKDYYREAITVANDTNMRRCMVTGIILPDKMDYFSVSHIWGKSDPLDGIKFVPADQRQKIYCSGRNHIFVLRSIEVAFTKGLLFFSLNQKGKLVTRVFDVLKSCSILDPELMEKKELVGTPDQREITFADIDNQEVYCPAYLPCRRLLAQRSAVILAEAHIWGMVSDSDYAAMKLGVAELRSISPDELIAEGPQPTALKRPSVRLAVSRTQAEERAPPPK
jgi:hypothetical protein